MPARTPERDGSVPVWDRFVRLSHWTLVVGFFVAYLAEDILTLHVWASYAVGVVVVLRILWGFLGPQHARFSDFLYRPTEVLAYARDLLALRGQRHLGHSPAGGAMVVALLLGLLATVGSGLVLYAIDDDAGPLAGFFITSDPTGEHAAARLAAGEAEDDEDDERQADQARGSEAAAELWEEAHEVLANLMLLLIALHVGGVLLASYVHREHLIKAMITGQKRPPS